MQTQLSYNYRDIVLDNNTYQSNKSILCSRCNHPVCQDFAALSCDDFTPSLKFKPPLRGFDNEKVNTFRLSKAWSKRLKPGSLVAIVNSKTNDVFGYARVSAIYVGGKRAMAEAHGQFNHNTQALNVTHDIADKMLHRLKAASGTMIYNSTDTVSVIYLEMCQV